MRGAGTKDVVFKHGTCSAIYTTEIVPNWEYQNYAGKELLAHEIPDPKKDVKRYNQVMKSTLVDLLIAEREIVFFEPAQLGPNGEVAAKSEDVAQEWKKRDQKIKARSGVKVNNLCFKGILQRSGNCNMASQRNMLRGHFLENGHDASVLEDHWAFAQSNGTKEVTELLKSKKSALQAELEMAQKLKQAQKANISVELAKLLSQYDGVQKETGWFILNKSWEIGRSKFSGNIAIANSMYQLELDKGNIVCIDKQNKYQKIELPVDLDIPFKEIQNLIPQPNVKIMQEEIINLPLPKKVPPLIVNPPLIVPLLPSNTNNQTEELKKLLNEYALHAKDNKPTWLNARWIVDVDKRGKVTLSNDAYLIELHNGNFSCKDRKAKNNPIPLPVISFPLNDLQNGISKLRNIDKPKPK